MDFAGLDMAMTQLTSLDLAPGFELVGNPGNEADRSDRAFSDVSERAQVLAWSQLATIAQRCIDRFGAVVRKWRWEGWNEPGHDCIKCACLPACLPATTR